MGLLQAFNCICKDIWSLAVKVFEGLKRIEATGQWNGQCNNPSPVFGATVAGKPALHPQRDPPQPVPNLIKLNRSIAYCQVWRTLFEWCEAKFLFLQRSSSSPEKTL